MSFRLVFAFFEIKQDSYSVLEPVHLFRWKPFIDMLKTIEVGLIKSDKDAISTRTRTSELNHGFVHHGFVRDLVQTVSSKESSNRTLLVAGRYRPWLRVCWY